MPPSGASDGEYRGLAVSQAEAVLEPPPPPPVVPQQHAGGLDLHSSLQPQVHAQPAACCSGRGCSSLQDSELAATPRDLGFSHIVFIRTSGSADLDLTSCKTQAAKTTVHASVRLVQPCVQGLPDTLSGGDLTSLHQLQPHQQPQHQQPRQQQLPTQFYGSGIYSGAAEYHPGAKAAFQAVPPAAQYDAPQMPGALPRKCKCV